MSWPDSAHPGVPLNPERDGWHWVQGLSDPFPQKWKAHDQQWALQLRGQRPEQFMDGCNYLGPCLTPAEVAAKVEAEREAWERAFEEVVARTTPRTGKSTARHETIKAAYRAAIRARGQQEGGDAG